VLTALVTVLALIALRMSVLACSSLSMWFVLPCALVASAAMMLFLWSAIRSVIRFGAPTFGGWAFRLITAVGLGMIITLFTFPNSIVYKRLPHLALPRAASNSMAPEIVKDDLVLLSSGPSISWGRHDVVLARMSKAQLELVAESRTNGQQLTGYLAKRVVGMPGDSVTVSQGSMEIRDAAGSIVATVPYPSADHSFTGKLGSEKYLLLGDNTQTSIDSRILGTFAAGQIVARAHAVVWPRFRCID